MLKTYTAKYTRIDAGYMGQLVEWPEVITEGKSLDDCRELLHDALLEMIAAYRQQHLPRNETGTSVNLVVITDTKPRC